jgi:LacI family transcriptional regulator
MTPTHGADITISGIARLAGVTKGTVSKVLNNYRGINEKTRQRVMKIVKEVGYEPNSAAQTLAFRRTGNIGLIIPHSPGHSLNGAYWSSLVSAITREATDLGYHLLLLLPQNEDRLQDLFTSIIRKKKVDGLIVSAEFLDRACISALLSSQASFVMLGRNPDLPSSSVDIDNRRAGADIASYLLERGYRRPLFAGGPSQYYYMRERADGFSDAVRSAGLEALPPLFIPYEDREAMRRALQEAARTLRPDSVVAGAGGDFMFDALTVFKDLDLEPPAFGFATFDDYRFLDFSRPPITAVAQPVSRMGSEAVRMLVGMLASHNEDQRRGGNVILPTTIVRRASCGEKGRPPA